MDYNNETWTTVASSNSEKILEAARGHFSENIPSNNEIASELCSAVSEQSGRKFNQYEPATKPSDINISASISAFLNGQRLQSPLVVISESQGKNFSTNYCIGVSKDVMGTSITTPIAFATLNKHGDYTVSISEHAKDIINSLSNSQISTPSSFEIAKELQELNKQPKSLSPEDTQKIVVAIDKEMRAIATALLMDNDIANKQPQSSFFTDGKFYLENNMLMCNESGRRSPVGEISENGDFTPSKPLCSAINNILASTHEIDEEMQGRIDAAMALNEEIKNMLNNVRFNDAPSNDAPSNDEDCL
jgi:hypothetical protein